MSQNAVTSSEKKVWVGFDLDGTKMMAVVFADDYRTLGQRRRKTRTISGAPVSLERIVETIQMALGESGVSADAVSGIGAGCPGQVDMVNGLIRETPNLGWKNVRLKEVLKMAFGCPAEICYDVDAGVYGEYRAGAAKGARCVVGVFPGTVIGGGCVYEDRILHGSRVSCMEFGFLQLATEGAAAGLGPVGTLEGLASRLAIAGEAAKAVYRGQAPWLARETDTDVSKIRSGVLAQSIEHGDTAIEAIFRRAAQQVGRGIGSIVNLLAPDTVVLEGGLVEAMPDLYLKETAAGAAAWARRCVEQPATV